MVIVLRFGTQGHGLEPSRLKAGIVGHFPQRMSHASSWLLNEAKTGFLKIYSLVVFLALILRYFKKLQSKKNEALSVVRRHKSTKYYLFIIYVYVIIEQP